MIFQSLRDLAQTTTELLMLKQNVLLPSPVSRRTSPIILSDKTLPLQAHVNLPPLLSTTTPASQNLMNRTKFLPYMFFFVFL